MERFEPSTSAAKPYMQTDEIELDGHERMLLDALLNLKEKDPTLSFRRSCREGVCGSCAMNIGGRNTLACTKGMDELPAGAVTISPLPNQPVLKDLVPDLTNFYAQYAAIEP